jgi:aminocarboxymuconate-semialdehyde decarboxylase
VIVDAHMHAIPPAVVELVRSGDFPIGMAIELDDAGAPWMVHAEGYRYPLAPEFHDVEAMLTALSARGADAGVVSPAPPLFGYDLGPADGLAVARTVNDSVAAMTQASGGRLAGLATLPLQSPGDAAAELERATGELGLIGAEVGTHRGDRWLDHPEMEPLLAAAERTEAVLFVHPYYTGAKPGLEDYYLTNLVGNPLDTGLCAARLILSGTLDRFPELRIVLAHGGGYMPYQIGRLEHGNAVRRELGICQEPPTSYLRRFAYDTITHASAPLRFLIDLVGSDRVLYGTDEPFDMGSGSFEEQTAGAGLQGGEAEQIGARTAEEYMRLGAALGAPS